MNYEKDNLMTFPQIKANSFMFCKSSPEQNRDRLFLSLPQKPALGIPRFSCNAQPPGSQKAVSLFTGGRTEGYKHRRPWEE